MSRYTLLLVLIIVTMVVTLTVTYMDQYNQLIDETATTGEVGSISGGAGEGIADQDDWTSVSGISGFITTYFGLMTFSVENVPALISLIFIPMQLTIGVIIGELIIKTADAIIPF